ncbi:MAG: hypothetical protein U9R48_08025 [Chloroflexota bacterium]|nr:hypothetical protein [Chloroflexota bacterium]
MEIGKIVNATSHIDYVCQVYERNETERAPQPKDYGFGTFVGIQQRDGGYLVGVIYNTTLLNPEFGNLGPHLSSEEDLEIFAPDYLAEKVTLVAIVILGAVEPDGEATQGVPLVAARIDDPVRKLETEEVVGFHQSERGLRLGYLSTLTAMDHPLATPLILQVVDTLSEFFPAESGRLSILRNNLSWRSRVEPMG